MQSISNTNAFSNDQESGVILRGSKRMQMNIFLTRAKDVSTLSNVSEGLFPVVWIDEVRYQQSVVCYGHIKTTLALTTCDVSLIAGLYILFCQKTRPCNDTYHFPIVGLCQGCILCETQSQIYAQL
jgi:hypothetical protein